MDYDFNALIIGLENMWQHSAPIIVNYGMSTLRALLVLIIGIWLARILSKRAQIAIRKLSHIDETVQNFIIIIIKYVIWIITIVLVLGQLGVQTTSIIALLGAAGIAIGLALQGTLQNIAAGIMILFLRPFRVGDIIESGNVYATVKQVGLFTTDFEDFKGHYVSVPNSNLWGATIINYTTNALARIDVDIQVTYDDDIDAVLATMISVAKANEEVADSPAPQAVVVAFMDNGAMVSLRCWAKSMDHWRIGFRMRPTMKKALEQAGFKVAVPQRIVRMEGEK